MGSGVPVSITIVCTAWRDVRNFWERRRKASRQDETRGTMRPKPSAFSRYGIDKREGMVYNTQVRGYSLMVKLQLPKLATRVRFPLPAPEKSTCKCKCFFQRRVPHKRNTSLHIAPQVQYFIMPQGITSLRQRRNITIVRFY